MSQIQTRNVTISSVVRAPAFREGFNDYMKGKPPQFDKDWSRGRRESPTDKAWNYERGRMFGAWLKSKGHDEIPRWFINRKLNWEIKKLASDAFWEEALR